jgi:hypothetical protein
MDIGQRNAGSSIDEQAATGPKAAASTPAVAKGYIPSEAP